MNKPGGNINQICYSSDISAVVGVTVICIQLHPKTFCSLRLSKAISCLVQNHCELFIDFRIIHPVLHYENLPMQYTDFFSAVKIEKFIRKTNEILNILAQNIDCGYPQSVIGFGSNLRKIGIPL